MQSSVDWQDSAPNASPEERVTVAAWRLLVGGQTVTMHRSAEQSFDRLVLPLCHLAEGLAEDWWTLFGARDWALSLLRHRAGFAMPDVRLRFDGAAFEVWAEAKRYDNPPVQFWGGATETLDRHDAEQQLSCFMEVVVKQLCAGGVNYAGAIRRWERVQASRTDPAEAAFCEAAGALRLDPYALHDGAAGLIEQASGLFEGEALLEFLSGISPARGRETVEWVAAVEDRPAHESRLPKLHGLADSVAASVPAQPGERGFALGYRRARAARQMLQLTKADSQPGTLGLSRKLGSQTFKLAPAVNGLRALRSCRRRTEHVHLRTQGPWDDARPGHLFALARAVGDAVCFPGPGRYPVNELLDAYRQSAGRAFAAEFLAPVDEVRSMHDDGLDAVSIAAEFGVSSAVVERQLENEGRIRTACAA